MPEFKREPVYLKGEVRDRWQVKMTRQDNDYVYFRVWCADQERDWFKLDIRCPKNKFRRL